MKKVLSIFAASIIAASAYSQAFWEHTTYAGAFEPAPTNRWTDTWTNWDPQNTAYGASTVNVSSDITTNTTWTNNNVYLLTGNFIYVDSLVTLTIEPGTVIRATGNAALIIGRGAKINAVGTPSQPIVFTSNAPAGSRDYGDWGGVVMNGTLACTPGRIVLHRVAESEFNHIKEIKVDTGVLKLDFYDNAEIDGDSISVTVNNKTILSHQLLGLKPITVEVRVSLDEPEQEVTMVAENLGTIPPNTALLIVTAGNKRYQLFLASNGKKNAQVRFVYEKPTQ